MVWFIVFVDSLARLFSRVKDDLGSLLVSRSERSLDDYVEIMGKSYPVNNEIIRYPDILNEIRYSIAYLDSSSRSIGFNIARLVITALAIYINGTIRSIPSPANMPEDTPPFIAVKSSENLLRKIESHKYIAVKNVVGTYYDLDYKDDNIADELRMSLENYGLRLLSHEEIDVVVIDGPIYQTPQIMLRAPNNTYGRTFLKLVTERVNVVEGIDKPVIGFVKRVEYSRKLARCDEIREIIKRRLRREVGTDVADPLIVEYILEDIVRPPLMKLVIIGPLTLRYEVSNKDISKILREKVYWYIGRKTLTGYQIARIEVLRKHWDKHRNIIEDMIKHLVSTLSMRAVPLGIEVVDRASRKLTALIYIAIYQKLSNTLSLSYDEYSRVSEVYRELG